MAASLKNKQYKLPNTLNDWEHVSVTWEDAFSLDGAAKASEVIADLKPCVRRSSGYVLEYTDTWLVIAAVDDRDSDTSQDCEDITVIPIPYVRRILRK